MHSWQNGTRCTDGVKVLWCHSHLVFEGSIPTCCCFHFENFLLDLFLLFFGMVKKERREVGGEAKGKMHASVKTASMNVHYFVFHKNKELL